MHLLRTTLSGDIVTEFLPPHLGEKPAKTNKVIIFCDGLPGMPGNAKTTTFFSKKGFWVFYPRYRGTWESGGMLLEEEPTKDILDVISAIQKPFVDAWGGNTFELTDPEIFVIGVSFGGPAALFASLDERVKKVVSLSGVVDWPAGEQYEPMEELLDIMERGYGEAYRVKRENWMQLAAGASYNPATNPSQFDKQKILMIQAVDDPVVPVAPTRTFVNDVGCCYIELKKGKHVSTSALTRWTLSRKVLKFLLS